MGCEVGGKHLKYAIAFAFLVTALVILCILFFRSLNPPPPNHPYSLNGIFDHAAVSTDAAQCASIGRSILQNHSGNAVDSAIATLFCMSLVIPESLGLGGGCFITLYDSKTQEFVTVDGREIAPSYAFDGMFKNQSTESRYGIKSIAIPGELKAYHALHSKYGSLPWSVLVEPSIKLAYGGFAVGAHLAEAIAGKYPLMNDTDLKAILTDPNTKKPYVEASIMTRHDLAETYKNVSKEGVDSIYSVNGSVVNNLINDLNGKGNNWTVDDIIEYKVNEGPAYAFNLDNNHTLYSVDPPGSGQVLGFIVDIVLRTYRGHKLPLSVENDSSVYYGRLVETFKYAYALRSLLGDPVFDDVNIALNYLKNDSFREEVAQNITSMTKTINNATSYFPSEMLAARTAGPVRDRGTSALVVIDESGSTVAVGSSINQYFGSFVTSKSTGIIMNDVMDDFSNHYSNQYGVISNTTYNLVGPGKRPQSSMAPVIVVSKATGQVVMAAGASGGSKITSSTANVILKGFLFDQPFEDIIDEKRLHHQLMPMLIEYEDGFDKKVLKHLESLGHKLHKVIGRTSVVMAIKREASGKIKAVTDPRKMGAVDGY